MRTLMRGVLAAAVVGLSTRVEAQRTPSSAKDSLYSSAESDFVVGKTVYLRSSKMRYGTILKTDAAHSFPRSFSRSPMKAVLIRRKDGPYEWTPVERITRIYVVNK